MARVIIFLFILVFNFFTISYAEDDVSNIIELYKSGKYQECITNAEIITKNDPTSVLSYYYIALSYVKLGKKDLAIKNYDKVIALGTNKALTNYAKTGKSKLQTKEAKEKAKQVTGAESMLEDVDEEKVEKPSNAKPEEKPKKVEEPQKQTPQPIAQKKNSKTNDGAPTNDEIVNAIRVLQRAGLLQGGLGTLNGNPQTQQPQPQTPQQYAQEQYQQWQQAQQQSYMDPRTQEMQQMLMMMNSGNNNNYNNNGNDMMQMLPFMQNGGKMSPQMIQMMMMKNMMPDFSSGNNNGY